MHYNLTNRVVLISGASRGLGAAIALELGRCGARVAVNYLTNQREASIVADRIKADGGNAEILLRMCAMNNKFPCSPERLPKPWDRSTYW
jgi:NAD(P)-dependent dehydrogenase (short-subunit alcohol dehydrogenase family)